MFRLILCKSCMVFLLLFSSFCSVNASSENLGYGKAIAVEAYKANEDLGDSRFALVIGINEYIDESIDDLTKSVNDAKAVYDTLANPEVCGIPKEHIVCLLNEQATTKNIEIELAKLRKCPKDSTIYIYYSGHGAKYQDEGYWVTHDCEISTLPVTGLANRDVNYWLSQINSEKVICLIDCCYAASTMGRGQKAVVHDIHSLLDKFTGKGRAFIMASGNEEALEDKDSDYSIFTRFMLDGLLGKADSKGIGNEDGVIVLTELSAYIDKHVSDVAASQDGNQKPVVNMDVQEPSKFFLTIVPEVRKKRILEEMQKKQTVASIKNVIEQAIMEGKLSIDFYKEQVKPLLIDNDIVGQSGEKKFELLSKVEKAGMEYDFKKLRKQFEVINAIYEVSNEQDEREDEVEFLIENSFASDKKYINSIGMEFVMVMPGSFKMGTAITEQVFNSDETPQREVRITRPFYLGVTEVTQKQWKQVMGYNPSAFKNDNSPVEMITWNDAKEFCQKLSEKEGRLYRLPTEAEWEFSCRAETSGQYNNDLSADSLHRISWCSSRSRATRSKPVKSCEPNRWGLYDMHGNVSEWCEDWYGEYLTTDFADPRGVSTGEQRVARGGSWSSLARDCRSASRVSLPEGTRSRCLGCRLVVDIRDSDLTN